MRIEKLEIEKGSLLDIEIVFEVKAQIVDAIFKKTSGDIVNQTSTKGSLK